MSANELFSELLQSERSYADELEGLIQSVAAPMRAQHALSDEQWAVLFDQLEPLFEESRLMIDHLARVESQMWSGTGLGFVATNLLDRLEELYPVYFDSMPLRWHLCYSMQAEDPAMQLLCSLIGDEANGEMLGLLMEHPLCRIESYMTLFPALLNVAPSGGVNRPLLTTVVQRLEQLAEQLAEVRTQWSHWQTVLQLQSEIDCSEVQEVDEHGKMQPLFADELANITRIIMRDTFYVGDAEADPNGRPRVALVLLAHALLICDASTFGTEPDQPRLTLLMPPLRHSEYVLEKDLSSGFDQKILLAIEDQPPVQLEAMLAQSVDMWVMLTQVARSAADDDDDDDDDDDEESEPPTPAGTKPSSPQSEAPGQLQVKQRQSQRISKRWSTIASPNRPATVRYSLSPRPGQEASTAAAVVAALAASASQTTATPGASEESAATQEENRSAAYAALTQSEQKPAIVVPTNSIMTSGSRAPPPAPLTLTLNGKRCSVNHVATKSNTASPRVWSPAAPKILVTLASSTINSPMQLPSYPEPKPEVEPTPESEPEPKVEPEPEPMLEPEPEQESEPETVPEPEQEPAPKSDDSMTFSVLGYAAGCTMGVWRDDRWQMIEDTCVLTVQAYASGLRTLMAAQESDDKVLVETPITFDTAMSRTSPFEVDFDCLVGGEFVVYRCLLASIEDADVLMAVVEQARQSPPPSEPLPPDAQPVEVGLPADAVGASIANKVANLSLAPKLPDIASTTLSGGLSIFQSFEKTEVRPENTLASKMTSRDQHSQNDTTTDVALHRLAPTNTHTQQAHVAERPRRRSSAASSSGDDSTVYDSGIECSQSATASTKTAHGVLAHADAQQRAHRKKRQQPVQLQHSEIQRAQGPAEQPALQHGPVPLGSRAHRRNRSAAIDAKSMSFQADRPNSAASTASSSGQSFEHDDRSHTSSLSGTTVSAASSSSSLPLPTNGRTRSASAPNELRLAFSCECKVYILHDHTSWTPLGGGKLNISSDASRGGIICAQVPAPKKSKRPYILNLKGPFAAVTRAHRRINVTVLDGDNLSETFSLHIKNAQELALTYELLNASPKRNRTH
ncbi:hypothetical protein THASP1DRAFT_31149 [Thamnocephalis sphaerospora]|uniref:DH domain-containing protein n=1 Tax=Thamnocephalis sphaerospora TaxID=78915 RepID=A0A4P9XP59_9FUNG|nr:hypothetical protein THASP1DRAFT_31149 [Thamnocephalis sphaerospora]|eukprot:RKP07040.1 hypothetical protein THASP1DRAFT_31149 [Thamnocephalis sphaerospora]